MKSWRVVFTGLDVGASKICPSCGAEGELHFDMFSGMSLWCTCPSPPRLRPDGTKRNPGEVMTLKELRDGFEAFKKGRK